MTPEERDELLIRLDERQAAAHKVLFGNGGGAREGLVSRVPVLEDDMRRREAEAKTLREAVPGKRNKALWNSGAITAVMIAVMAAAKEVFG